MAGPWPMPPAKDGTPRWRIYADAGVDAVTGERRRIGKVVRGSKRDAELAHARLLVDVGDGRHAGSGEMTFGGALDAYVAHKSLSLEATSADTYRRQLAYIPDRLRALPVTKIGVEHLEALYAHLATAGHKRTGGPLAAKSIRNVHAVIYGTFELARRRRWVAINPAADAEPPDVKRRLPTPAAAERMAALFAAADAIYPVLLPAYIRTTLAVGGRRSEIHGIRWSAIDWTRGVITLRDTIVFAAGAWQIKPRTKTGGARPVIVDPGTLAALQAVYDRAFANALSCGIDLPADAFVFTDAPDGAVPWRPATTARRFSRACAAAGLPATTRLHDLRHLMATHLIDQGVPIPVVSARLGHAQNSTTLDIYTGRVAASDQGAADVMGDLLGP